MLQSITLIGLVVEFLILTVFGFLLRNQGFTLILTLLVCGCLAVVWRVLVCLLSAIVAGALRRAAGKALPFGNSVRAFRVELRAKMLSMSVLQPFHPLVIGAEPKNADPAMPPIVLVHGYVSNRGIWTWFRKQLQLAKPQAVIYTLTIEPVFGSIDACALQLAARLGEIGAQHPNQPITIIAHSMGGLMTRAYMRDCAIASRPHGLGKLICLGSPHAGSQFARFGFGTCAQDMGWKSPWILALQAFEVAHPLLLPIVCVYTLNDDLVYPAESGALVVHHPQSPHAVPGVEPNVENIAVSAVGHVSLLFSPDVMALVLKRL